MTRRRLPWLLALPLMAAGSVTAHLVGAALAPAGPLDHEVAGHGERTSAGVAGQSVMVLGVLVALLVAFALYGAGRRRGATRRGLGAGCFSLLPVVAYSAQEVFERLLHAESFPFHAVLEPRFLLGLALQAPFAAVAFLTGWSLLRAGTRLLRLLGATPLASLRDRPVRLRRPPEVTLARIRALSRGHPLRGPPLLA